MVAEIARLRLGALDLAKYLKFSAKSGVTRNKSIRFCGEKRYHLPYSCNAQQIKLPCSIAWMRIPLTTMVYFKSALASFDSGGGG
jgi:hypothetical protein